MVPGAAWFTYIDPITYAFRALIGPHFWCFGASAGVDASCPLIQTNNPNTPEWNGTSWIVQTLCPSGVSSNTVAMFAGELTSYCTCVCPTNVPQPPAGSGYCALQSQNDPTMCRADVYTYVSTWYEIDYDTRWNQLGYLVIFIAFFQITGMLATRYVRHIVR